MSLAKPISHASLVICLKLLLIPCIHLRGLERPLTTDIALLLRDFCGWYFVLRFFEAFCATRYGEMYEDEHLNFKNQHCTCVPSASFQPRIREKNPVKSEERR